MKRLSYWILTAAVIIGIGVGWASTLVAGEETSRTTEVTESAAALTSAEKIVLSPTVGSSQFGANLLGEEVEAVLSTEQQNRMEQTSLPIWKVRNPQPCAGPGLFCRDNAHCAAMCNAAGCEMGSSFCYDSICDCCLI
ncbi:MAG: hypothetical protein K0U98_15725 [Deltaproteobacteria bacterium]|nr:hypothetical protein [Deltaproteobacteria bacterium]